MYEFTQTTKCYLMLIIPFKTNNNSLLKFNLITEWRCSRISHFDFGTIFDIHPRQIKHIMKIFRETNSRSKVFIETNGKFDI